MSNIQLKRTPTTVSLTASTYVAPAGEPLAVLETGEVRIGNGVDIPSALPSSGAIAAASALTAYKASIPTLDTNRALDPQQKTSGGSTSSSSYPSTRITAGLPAGFAYGLQTTRTDVASTTLSQMYLGAVSGSSRIPVTPGEVISAAASVWTDQAGMKAYVKMSFLNAAGTYMSDVNGTPSAAISQNAWERRTAVGVTVPAGAAYVYLQIIVSVVSGTSAPEGGVVRATGLQVVTGATLTPYGDGTFSGWAWTDAAHASASRKVYVTSADLAGASGPAAGVTDATLIGWSVAESYSLTGAVVYDVTTSLVTSANIIWPDGTAGAFAGTVNTTWRAYDGWTVTYVAGGRKVTQTAPTRDADGFVLTRPAPTAGVI